MYPFIRMTKELIKARSQPPLDVWDTHVSHHICWPWDIDLWMELNNGRTLTIYDLGRIPLAHRTGLIGLLKKERWSLTMAGASVRWRRRVRPFEKVEMRSRALGFDHRFFYLEQSMWNTSGECANHALYRSAVTDRNGIVSPDRIVEAFGAQIVSPALPDWVVAWTDADAKRPWPPMQTP
ncbi:acyl-CoA thioesterase [Primorskyibacter sp. S187A]|uniref:acyl-CoA thioesterase n=1 Tax=Primorskyibacter sp. S187A TaxID=3415130 RepID=UPI003C7D3083